MRLKLNISTESIKLFQIKIEFLRKAIMSRIIRVLLLDSTSDFMSNSHLGKFETFEYSIAA